MSNGTYGTPPTIIGESPDTNSSFELRFIGDRRRFAVAFAFALLATSNGAQWLTFGPIVEEVKEHFDITAYEVNMLASVYMFVYLVAATATCVTYDKLGLRNGLLIAAFSNVLSTVVKLIAILFLPKYPMLVLSQIFGAMTQTLIISVPALISNTWFLAQERTVFTALMSNCMNLGIGIGMVMPPLMINSANKDQAAFLKFFVVQAAWAGVALVAIVVGVPRRPHTPPSFAADAMADMENVEMIPSIRQLVRNRSFNLLAVLSGGVIGVIWALAAVLPQVLLPFGVSESNTGWMGFSNMVSGSLVASIACYFIGRSGHLKGSLMAMGGLLVGVMGLWLFLLRSYQDASVGISFGCFIFVGFFANTMFPVMMELGVELTYPLPEQISSTALMWVPMGSSIALIQAMSAILGNNADSHQASWVMVISILIVTIGVFAALHVVPIHHRTNFETASAQSSPTKVTESPGYTPISATPI